MSDRERALKDFGRAGGGALLFSLPMLMTMEFWSLGLYLDRTRLFLLFAATLPLLVLLSRRIGFADSRRWADDVLDTLIALGIGILASTIILAIFGSLTSDEPLDAVLGKIAIQAVPASLGALLAKSQFGAAAVDDGDEPSAGRESYGGELFLMGVGALFLGFNVAPTDEVILISFQMSPFMALALVILSLALMHGFVFAVGFAGGSEVSPDDPWWSAFLRMTLPGYILALSVSLFLLWVFARTDGMSADGILLAGIVLAFPSAIGAAAARLIL